MQQYKKKHLTTLVLDAIVAMRASIGFLIRVTRKNTQMKVSKQAMQELYGEMNASLFSLHDFYSEVRELPTALRVAEAAIDYALRAAHLGGDYALVESSYSTLVKSMINWTWNEYTYAPSNEWSSPSIDTRLAMLPMLRHYMHQNAACLAKAENSISKRLIIGRQAELLLH
jgi:hypothetical protein